MTDQLMNTTLDMIEKALSTPAQEWLGRIKVPVLDDSDKAADARYINNEGRDVMGINNRWNQS